MTAIIGKVWCVNENEITILNPNLLIIEVIYFIISFISLLIEKIIFFIKHQFTIDCEKNILIATGGNSSYAVWIAYQNSLDLKLYHATKYSILAEVNLRQCISQKLAGLDDLIRIHKLSCLKITCLHVCKDTLWIGTSAGIICNIKIPHINNTTNKFSTALSVNGKF